MTSAGSSRTGELQVQGVEREWGLCTLLSVSEAGEDKPDQCTNLGSLFTLLGDFPNNQEHKFEL